MQINDINNLEVGGQDKTKGMGIDIAQFKNKVHANHSNRQEDITKLDKDKLGVINMSNSTYNNPSNNTIMDEIDKDLGADGKANTASTLNQRNFDAIEKLGFDSKDIDEKEFVDIADKIRIAMAKGGADISMMGDVSDAAIKQSGAYTNALENVLEKAQLPTDNKTIEDSVLALRKVEDIRANMTQMHTPEGISDNQADNLSLSEETIKYMLLGELDPTIDNVYKASTHSNDYAIARPVDIQGNMKVMESQFEELLTKAGLDINEENLQDCYWMVNNRINVTPEQLVNLQELRNLRIDDMINVIKSISNALIEGRTAGEAYLVPGHSPLAKAEAIAEGVQSATPDTIDTLVSNNEELTLGNIARQAIVDSNNNSESKALQELQTPDYISVETVEEGMLNNTVKQEGSPNIGTPYNEVTAKKQLVQVQLMMSTEANFALLKRGVSIDTLKLNEYVNALEELEQQFLETMLGDKATPETIKTLSDSMDAVQTSKQLPDYAMPLNASTMTLRSYASVSISYSEETITQSTTNQDVSSQKVVTETSIEASFSRRFNQAADYYEASATEVRRDLGDSLRKAFGNVDNILREMNLERTEENRRAVRILGYNQMEITSESVKEVKATDLTVSRALENLKPGVVCEMIKAGLNPLDMTMEELLQSSQEIIDTMEVSSEEEKFYEFLWRLEQENGITEEEREGFIGVFRLIHQVNKSDGAAIGMLLDQGVDVTMRNLLMATRNAKHTNKEYTIDDDFGGIEGFNKDSLNIEQQIEMSIQSTSMRNIESKITPQKMMQFNSESEYMSLTPEQLSNRLDAMESNADLSTKEQQLNETYAKMRREEVLESFKADRQVVEYLEANDIPLTSNNLNAITQLMTDRNSMYRTLLNKAARRQVGLDRDGSYASEVGMEAEDRPKTLEEEVDDIIANLIHEYGESVKTPEDMAEAERRLEEIAENVMKNMIVEEDISTIDVRGMHLIQTQLTTLGEVSRRSENYVVPIMVADEVGNLNLKIVRGKEEKGLVDIAFNMEKTGTVTASFRYEAGEFIGEVNCDRENTRELLERHHDALNRSISSNTNANSNIRFAWSKKIDANNFAFSERETDFEVVSKTEALDGENEVQTILTKNLYGMARAFIEELGNI